MKFPEPPKVQILMDGNPLEMPTHPVWSTNQNGLMDNTTYEVAIPEGDGRMISVDAPQSVLAHIDIPTMTVRFTWRGKTKTYLLKKR